MLKERGTNVGTECKPANVSDCYHSEGVYPALLLQTATISHGAALQEGDIIFRLYGFEKPPVAITLSG